ncbi:MAG: YggS family pyridoxal phosphate-dependent enzyme [bacterium]
MSIAENIKEVKASIERACGRANRGPQTVKLVVVTKAVDASRIQEAVAAGVTCVGENRVQEAWQKFNAVDAAVHWHLIGHLQTNKVRRALQFVQMIHSVDSTRLAHEIQVQAEKLDKTVEVLIQVNTSGEESKFGLAPEEALPAIKEMAQFPRVQIKGLMTIGAFTTEVEVVQGCFRRLRELRDRVEEHQISGVVMHELSMGMTNDFELAIEEGATMVRIGRSIFGERQ